MCIAMVENKILNFVYGGRYVPSTFINGIVNYVHTSMLLLCNIVIVLQQHRKLLFCYADNAGVYFFLGVRCEHYTVSKHDVV